MLAHLDEWFKEATHNYNKPFGGVAVLMLRDFEQQPPIGGSSLPHLVVHILQQEYQQKHNIFYTKLSKQQTVELCSTLCQRGVKLFETAGYLKLSIQYHCTNDPEHIDICKEMNTGISLTPSDFEFYQTLSQSDFNDMNNNVNPSINGQTEAMGGSFAMKFPLTKKSLEASISIAWGSPAFAIVHWSLKPIAAVNPSFKY